MYLNKDRSNQTFCDSNVEPKHVMYLNVLDVDIRADDERVEPKHVMYLNHGW